MKGQCHHIGVCGADFLEAPAVKSLRSLSIRFVPHCNISSFFKWRGDHLSMLLPHLTIRLAHLGLFKSFVGNTFETYGNDTSSKYLEWLCPDMSSTAHLMCSRHLLYKWIGLTKSRRREKISKQTSALAIYNVFELGVAWTHAFPCSWCIRYLSWKSHPLWLYLVQNLTAGGRQSMSGSRTRWVKIQKGLTASMGLTTTGRPICFAPL